MLSAFSLRRAASRHWSRSLHPVLRTAELARGLCDDPALTAFTALIERGLGVGSRLREQQDIIVEQLAKKGWCIVDGALDNDTAACVRNEAAGLYADGCYSLSYSQVAETGEKIWRDNVFAAELEGSSWRSAPKLVAFLSELMAELPQVINDGFVRTYPLKFILKHL